MSEIPGSGGRNLVALAGFAALCFAVAAAGGAATATSVGTWYAGLAKPAFNPPDWVFGPVWTCLYVTMAVAAWLVWREQGFSAGRIPLVLFAVQLALNAVWSGLFFGLRAPGLAFADIVLLWIAILATLIAFGRVSTWAAALLVPYLAWVSFAAALNWTLWRMNA